jgi:5'-3' exonuclease
MSEILLVDAPFEVSRLYHVTRDINRVIQYIIRDIICMLRYHKLSSIFFCWDNVLGNIPKDSPYNNRKKLYSEYKSNRKLSYNNDIWKNIQKNILPFVGITQIFCKGAEADDLIYTIILDDAGENDFTIFSGDHDFVSLLSDKVSIMDSVNHLITRESFIKENHFFPERMYEVLVLAGDQSDNVKGVGGISEETAISLLKGFDSLESLLSMEEIELNGKEISKDIIKSNMEILRLRKVSNTQVLKGKVDIKKLFESGYDFGKYDRKYLQKLFNCYLGDK